MMANTGSIVVITDSMLGPTRFMPANENMKGTTVPNNAKAPMYNQLLVFDGNSTVKSNGKIAQINQ
jgi:hypothetical protein